MKKSSLQPSVLMATAYIAWFFCAIFYCYQYILRVSPGIMVTDLRKDFQMTAEQFSTLGAFYLYAYSLLQIPLGVIIDRIGVRRTVLGSVFLCVLGSLFLGFADHLYMVQISRIFIGAGSACAFMAALKIVADYLPEGRRGFLMGATLTLGTIGALFAGKPLVMIIDASDWRFATFVCAGLGAVLFFLIWLKLRLPAIEQKTAPLEFRPLFKQIGFIMANSRVMLYALLAIGLYTPLSVLADLWGTAFLMQKFSLTRASAAQLAMMMYFGLAIGSLLLPWLSEKWQVLNGAIKVASVAIFSLFAWILFGPSLGPQALGVSLMVLGIFCGAEMMCFTGAVRYTTAQNSGLTIGIVNTLNMLGGAVLQQGVGYVLDLRWNGGVDAEGIRIYNTEQFVMALSLLLAVVGFCCLISLKLRPKAIMDPAQHKK